MINITKVKRFCADDISKIENYGLAIADKSQTWHCHHRRGISENKSHKRLKKEGLYYKRPACELIFLPTSEHIGLHSKGRKYWLGKQFSDEHKQKLSIAHMGENNPNFGKQFSKEHKQKLSVSHINNPKKSKIVLQYTKDGQFIAEYPSTKEAYRQTNINNRHISECCNGKRKAAGGYIWKYKK